MEGCCHVEAAHVDCEVSGGVYTVVLRLGMGKTHKTEGTNRKQQLETCIYAQVLIFLRKFLQNSGVIFAVYAVSHSSKLQIKNNNYI